MSVAAVAKPSIVTAGAIVGHLIAWASILSGVLAYVYTIGAGYLYAHWLGAVLAAVTPGVSSLVLPVLLWMQEGRAPWIFIGVLAVPLCLQLAALLLAVVVERAARNQ